MMEKFTLDAILEDKYVNTAITLFLVCYGGLAKPTLPKMIEKLFDNQVFRIFVLAFIAYRGNKNPQISLLVAIAFTITLNNISEKNNKESFKQLEQFVNLEHYENDETNEN